ncbi:hypothetical protein RFI_02813, partial [Reticulomyxa filosa]
LYKRSKKKKMAEISDTAKEDKIYEIINKGNGKIIYCPCNAKEKKNVQIISPNERLPTQPKDSIRVVALGCTHDEHQQVWLPPGDILIHSGDICRWSRPNEKVYGYKWREKSDKVWYDFITRYLLYYNDKYYYKYGIYVIPGNHDSYLYEDDRNFFRIQSLLKRTFERDRKNDHNSHHHKTPPTKAYLCYDKLITLSIPSQSNSNKILRIFASPISWFRGKPSNAFQVHRHEQIDDYPNIDLWKMDKRPHNMKWTVKDYIHKYFPLQKYFLFVYYYLVNIHIHIYIYRPIDILITHGPCHNYGDSVDHRLGSVIGSKDLYQYITHNKIKFHVCSDYHGDDNIADFGYGVKFLSLESSSKYTSTTEEEEAKACNDKTDSSMPPTQEANTHTQSHCIVMNVAISHCPAKQLDVVKRGVTIFDIDIKSLSDDISPNKK